MDRQDRDYILRVAELVIKKFEIAIPIANMDDVVTKLNGRIKTVDDPYANTSVLRLDQGDMAFEITISSHHGAARRSFAIANEIGHLFLHMGYGSDLERWSVYDHTMAMEEYTEKAFQANEFALNFLMPKKQYMDFISNISDGNHIDAYAIADHFGVSESMATFRGKLIGALTWN